jgi:lysophospholipase L1-like esterase
MSQAALRYLALGDSYTIGTGASHPSRNFPSLLAWKLEAATGRQVDLQNPAVHGYATVDLLREEAPHLGSFRPQLVTLLIGVNDLVDGVSEGDYRNRLRGIVAAVYRQLEPSRTALIAIPDFSLAPAASRFGDPADLQARLERFNAIADEQARRAGSPYVDIVPISREGARRPGWFAEDQLHPGDAQYSAWAEVMWQLLGPVWTSAVARL